MDEEETLNGISDGTIRPSLQPGSEVAGSSALAGPDRDIRYLIDQCDRGVDWLSVQSMFITGEQGYRTALRTLLKKNWIKVTEDSHPGKAMVNALAAEILDGDAMAKIAETHADSWRTTLQVEDENIGRVCTWCMEALEGGMQPNVNDCIEDMPDILQGTHEDDETEALFRRAIEYLVEHGFIVEGEKESLSELDIVALEEDIRIVSSIASGETYLLPLKPKAILLEIDKCSQEIQQQQNNTPRNIVQVALLTRIRDRKSVAWVDVYNEIRDDLTALEVAERKAKAMYENAILLYRERQLMIMDKRKA